MTYLGDPGQDGEALRPDQYDCNSTSIPSQRDLEDWARLWICGMPVLTNAGYQVSLSWTNVSGNPAIQIVDAVETNGGTLYLTDTNTAATQASNGSGGRRYKYPAISATNALTLSASYFTSAGNKYFLFEGAGVGSGELRMTLSQNGTNLAQTGAWLDLHDIKDFYELARATNVTSSIPPSSLVSQLQMIRTVGAAPDETKQIIVFVHGINNTDVQVANSTETIFKRLYWSGYRGRLAAFRWPCAYLPNESSINPLQLLKAYNFNKGEFFAWKSAAAFSDYLTALRARFPDYSLNVFAHSQGSVVFSEAAMQGAPFDNCILTQGAIPASCYDPAAPTLAKLLTAEQQANAATPDYTTMGYRACFTNISGNVVNFFNTNDFALVSGTVAGLQTNWEENQRTLKPESFTGIKVYRFDGTNCLAIYSEYRTDIITDPHEQKSMVARSRTAAVGGSGGLGGVIDTSFDLGIALGFGQTRKEHSAQFTRPIQTAKGYYDAIFDLLDTP